LRFDDDVEEERTGTPRHVQESVASTVGGEGIRYLEIIVEDEKERSKSKARTSHLLSSVGTWTLCPFAHPLRLPAAQVDDIRSITRNLVDSASPCMM
jgi:hypothetical protein